LTFQDAQFRLLALVRERIHNGELTERGLARRIGISQPHAHNVLKGARNLSPEVFDSLLRHLHLSILDLAADEELQVVFDNRRRLRRPEVPFLASGIGPGRSWPGSLSWQEHFPLPSPAAVARSSLAMARITPDTSLQATAGGYDIALLDLSDRHQSRVTPGGLYVVDPDGEAVLRFVLQGARQFYLTNDVNRDLPAKWRGIATSRGTADFVRARVLWLGREADRGLDQAGRFLVAAISW